MRVWKCTDDRDSCGGDSLNEECTSDGVHHDRLLTLVALAGQ